MAVFSVLDSGSIPPYIGFLGTKGDVFTQIDFGSIRGEYLTGEFGVFLRSRQHFRGFIAGFNTGIILFSIKDGCMTDRPGNAGAPMGQIGAENLGGPVGIGQ